MTSLGTPLLDRTPTTLPAAPTKVRWRILALLMAYAAFCHFNRISISVAGTEHIIKEYSLEETQMGMVYSSYLFIYTLFMVPGGWLIDRFGPKKALMLLGFGSALLVPLTGAASFAASATILIVLCVIRGALGIISAPMHPGAARAVSFWIPYPARGVANGMVTGAAVTGIASTYFVFGQLMDFTGWPAAFVVAGAATLCLAIVWTFYATDHPEQHPAVNGPERDLIAHGDPMRGHHGTTLGHNPSGSLAGLLKMFGDRNLVLLTLSYAMYSYFQYLFFYWMQYYFDTVLKLGTEDARLYSTITMLAMAAGMTCGGRFADWVELHFGGRRARAIAPVCGMIASSLLLILGIMGSQPGWVVTCFALSMGALGASESPFWVTGIELGRERGGLSGAFLNAGGNAGGILAPVITPLFSKFFGWQAGLCLASVICMLGAALWWWIDLRHEEVRSEA